MSETIPLIFDKLGYVTVNIFVRATKYRVSGPVKFFVDTGSPESFLSEEDAARLNFPFRILRYDKQSFMGGSKIQTAEIKDIRLIFKLKRGSETIKIPVFRVAHTMRKGKKSTACNYSILGNDFLILNKYSLHVNPIKQEAYYKKEG